MDEDRIEDALRAGSPDEPPYRDGAVAQALAERSGVQLPAARGVSYGLGRQGFPAISAGFVVLVVILLVVVSSGRLSPHETVGGSPRSAPATAAVTPVSSAIASALPAALVDRWLAEASGGVSPTTRAVLDIRGAEARYGVDHTGTPDRFRSSVAPGGPGELVLTAIGSAGGCQPYDQGVYRLSLSPAATTLTLDVVRDDCSDRASAVAGNWTHTACRDATVDCLGPLEAGTYRSSDVDLDGTGHVGQLEYRVPDGWANTIDFSTNYFLRPTEDYRADPGSDGNDTVGGIYVWAGTLAADQPADCAGLAAPGVPRAAEAIAGHLKNLPGLVVKDGGTIEIDSRPARVLDLSVAPNYAGTCPWAAGRPFRSLITMADGGPDRGVWGLNGSERARVLLVDLAPGRVASIWIDGPPDRFDALVEASTPIIESFRFRVG